MLKVGITGGIGSGKTIVSRVFATLGIPVFNADDAARYLQENDESLKAAIMSVLGPGSYVNGLPDRDRIAAIIYASPGKLQQLNSLVHPATIRLADEWMQRQVSPYVIKEAAIFFESGSYKSMDVMVGVYAPAEMRIARAMQRGNLPRHKVERIIAMQMNEEEKMERCNHVITNDGTVAILPQVLALHDLLLTRATHNMPLA